MIAWTYLLHAWFKRDRHASQKNESSDIRLSAPSRARRQNKGGRPEEHKWAAIKEIAFQRIKALGLPGRHNKRLPSKAQLIEHLQTECVARFGREPPTSSLKTYLNQWLAEVVGKSET
jgi:hypothetical protein